MKFEDVKHDDVITHQSGLKYRVKMVGTDRRLAVRREGESSPIYFVTEPQLKYYTGEPKFFKMGKTYKFKSGNRTDKWVILDIYEVDKPVFSGNGTKAIAKMITPGGKEDIQTLGGYDFERMVQV